MRAIQFKSSNLAQTVDLAVPSVGEGQVLIRVKSSGLCHTDIEILRGNYGNDAFPLVPGHEFSGVVEAVAADVKSVTTGQRVVIDPNISCGTCRSCKQGLYNLCEDLKAYGVTQDGGFAEYCVVAADHVHDIGNMDFELAALAEPLGCVLNGLAVAGVTGSKILPLNSLVFGAGPIGLLLGLALKSAGVHDVAVADLNEHRLAFAQSLGFTAVMSGTPEVTKMMRSIDFVADATGIASVVESMIGLTADGGTAMVFGVCPPDARIAIGPFEFFRRQIKLVGSHSLNHNIPAALTMLARDNGTMARLVSDKLELKEILPFLSKGGGNSRTMKVQYSGN